MTEEEATALAWEAITMPVEHDRSIEIRARRSAPIRDA